MTELVEKAIAAMEDDPFTDDVASQGTTQQGQRFEHYAGLIIPIVLAEAAKVAREYAGRLEDDLATDIAAAIEKLGGGG